MGPIGAEIQAVCSWVKWLKTALPACSSCLLVVNLASPSKDSWKTCREHNPGLNRCPHHNHQALPFIVYKAPAPLLEGITQAPWRFYCLQMREKVPRGEETCLRPHRKGLAEPGFWLLTHILFTALPSRQLRPMSPKAH